MIVYPFWPYPMDPAHPRNKHEAAFWAIHPLKPHIYRMVDAAAHQRIADGRSRYGIEDFMAEIRWNTHASMDPPEPFKINDRYAAYYARFWLQNNPQHWGFFVLRRVKGEYPQPGEEDPPPPAPPWFFNGQDQGELF